MLDKRTSSIRWVGRGSRPLSPEWLLLSLLLVAGLLFAVNTQLFWRMDQLFYDLQLKFWSRPPPDDIVIVAIDSNSLARLGRWPWKRSLHAELIDRLSAAGAKGIFMDILFVEPDSQDPQGDKRLAEAMARSGRVFLPVIIEQLKPYGVLSEALPLPMLRSQAMALGHVDIDLDPDGIARRVFLREGLGAPDWPSVSVAILQKLDPEGFRRLPGGRNPGSGVAGKQTIVRDHHILIPFAGPPGHFHQISYLNVIRGDFPQDAFKGKIVLVGATAPGLGDLVPTPVSGYNRPMSGVEINANLIDALRQGITVQTLDLRWQMAVTGTVLLLAFLSFPLVRPRWLFPLVSLMLLSIVVFATLLLQVMHLWFPPTAIVIGLIFGFPLWSWRRLVRTVRYFEQELRRLREEPRSVGFYQQSGQMTAGLNFLQSVVAFDSWLLLDAGGQVIDGSRGESTRIPSPPSPEGRPVSDDCLWIAIPHGESYWQLGLVKRAEQSLDAASIQLVKRYVEQFAITYRAERRGNVELVERQVRRVQSAIADLRWTRQLLSDTLRQMVDGVLVINLGGQVVMSNRQASHYLGLDVEAELSVFDLLTLAERLEIKGDTTLVSAFREVLVEGKVSTFEGRVPQGSELMVQISPLTEAGGHFNGAMIILSDITRLKASERQRTQTLNFLSHDLRSPLASMISMLEIQRAGVGQPNIEELMERIEQYASKALRLADDFLRLARAEGVNVSAFQEVDLVAVAHNAVDSVYAEAKEKSIRLQRNFQADDLWVKADPALLERALINLLENAIRYSPSGSTVALWLESDTQQVYFRVTDQGRGIALADQAKIFAPFQQIRKGSKTGEKGTGLGLALVKVVAEKHRGKITVQSEIDEGTEFSLILPINN